MELHKREGQLRKLLPFLFAESIAELDAMQVVRRGGHLDWISSDNRIVYVRHGGKWTVLARSLSRGGLVADRELLQSMGLSSVAGDTNGALFNTLREAKYAVASAYKLGKQNPPSAKIKPAHATFPVTKSDLKLRLVGNRYRFARDNGSQAGSYYLQLAAMLSQVHDRSFGFDEWAVDLRPVGNSFEDLGREEFGKTLAAMVEAEKQFMCGEGYSSLERAMEGLRTNRRKILEQMDAAFLGKLALECLYLWAERRIFGWSTLRQLEWLDTRYRKAYPGAAETTIVRGYAS